MYGMCSWMYRTFYLVDLEPLTLSPFFGLIKPGNGMGGVEAVNVYMSQFT